VIRTSINRLLAFPIAAAITHVPALEQFISAKLDSRRLHIALTRLRRRGLKIEIVYDIGARLGWWTETVRPSLPGARFFLFEGNDMHTKALQETGERYFTAILSSEEKLVEFYATGGPGDSYFREASEHFVGVTPRTLRATTLDHIVETHDLPDPDLIKADVQGAELDVLRGGTKALDKAKLVLLECPIVEYNEGAPNIHEYFRFMDERGFTPIDFLGRTWRHGRVIQIDVLFADIRAHHAVIG
jgi:FkbM family methyltransferase